MDTIQDTKYDETITLTSQQLYDIMNLNNPKKKTHTNVKSLWYK